MKNCLDRNDQHHSKYESLIKHGKFNIRTASSESGNYRICEQRRFRWACACAVSPEPPLLAHTSNESRGTFRQKARSLAPLNGWACAVKIFVMTECSKTQIRLTGLIRWLLQSSLNGWMFSDYLHVYRNDPKFSDTQKMCCNHIKVWTMWLYHRVMSSNDADRMANSVDPDQTAPLGAVWSGSALFAQAYLSENLGSLQYKCIYSVYVCLLIWSLWIEHIHCIYS